MRHRQALSALRLFGGPVCRALLLGALAFAPKTEAGEQPNILLIVADDLGFSDLGCYGSEISTPNLDALAARGLRFTQFYNTARCWPSRAAIMTGYYAQQVRRDTVPGIPSGTAGVRPAWAPLLPAMLQRLGYRCYHSGKWHLDGKPLQNGFDHSYSLNDHDRYFAPKLHTLDDKPLPAVDAASGYYATTAIASHAIGNLKEHAGRFAGRPFFAFIAFTSPHFPVQAPANDIARYHDRYLEGWDELRWERWLRLKVLGIGGSALSPVERDIGPPYAYPDAIAALGPNEVNRPVPWESLGASQRRFQADKMSVHAAMVDRMDREIGRVLEQVEAMGATTNTIVLFLSDNGASAEMMVRGDGHDPDAACGTGATFLSIGPGWSTMANTPFRRHKTWVHEGGISTPLIVAWPAGIPAHGELRHAAGHVVDLVPTLLGVAGGTRPATWAGVPTPRAPGVDLRPAFARDVGEIHATLWWQHEGNRALRKGRWKLVAAGEKSPWELYDMSSDRSETHNVAASHPKLVRELEELWRRQEAENLRLASPTTTEK
jgi:arylsulfatase A-like enzyme